MGIGRNAACIRQPPKERIEPDLHRIAFCHGPIQSLFAGRVNAPGQGFFLKCDASPKGVLGRGCGVVSVFPSVSARHAKPDLPVKPQVCLRQNGEGLLHRDKRGVWGFETSALHLELFKAHPRSGLAYRASVTLRTLPRSSSLRKSGNCRPDKRGGRFRCPPPRPEYQTSAPARRAGYRRGPRSRAFRAHCGR